MIPKTMKAVKAFGPSDLRLVDVPLPVPGRGEVLVRMRASGVCGSDKWYWRNSGPVEMIAGHELAGEVVQIGPGARLLKEGDRVAINNVVGCGECPACRKGEFVRCARRPGKDVNNGFAEYSVAPERNCLKLHPRIGFEAGCLIFDNWGTPYAAIRKAGVKAGDKVLVSGCGPVGMAAVVLCAGMKARVTAVDPLDYRRDAAIKLGALTALAPESLSPGVFGIDGADIVIECSGKGAAYGPALGVLRIGGTFVSVGEGAVFELKPSDLLIRNHLNLLGTWYTTMEQGRQVRKLMLGGRISDPSIFVTHRLTLQELPAAFGDIVGCSKGIMKAVILSD